MQWLNEPRTWSVSGNGLSARSQENTDFWRQTHDGGIRDNGHFYFSSVSGDFTAQVKLTGEYDAQYDQAGLMVRIDERTWLKCGIEYVDGRQYASTVITRDYSDWSVIPVANSRFIWIQCERRGVTFTVRYSLDGSEYMMIRQSYLTRESEQQIGMMLASPKGEGFAVLFEDYLLTTP
jgi:regulation of enolase protein 1 (concanavalin A-like superfamily)